MKLLGVNLPCARNTGKLEALKGPRISASVQDNRFRQLRVTFRQPGGLILASSGGRGSRRPGKGRACLEYFDLPAWLEPLVVRSRLSQVGSYPFWSFSS